MKYILTQMLQSFPHSFNELNWNQDDIVPTIVQNEAADSTVTAREEETGISVCTHTRAQTLTQIHHEGKARQRLDVQSERPHQTCRQTDDSRS